MKEGLTGDRGAAGPPGHTQDYVRLGTFYANTSLRLTRLWLYLWQQSDQFLGSEGKARSGVNRWSRFLPGGMVKASRVARLIRRYLSARRSLADGESSSDGRLLSLPVKGDLAIVRRSGAVKVLDVEAKRVYTLVTDEAEKAKLSERVELTSAISHLPFAPRIEEVDLERGFFSEEFLSGSHPLNFKGCGDDFADVYRPLLVEFLAAFPAHWRNAAEYLASLREEILDPSGLLAMLGDEKRTKVTEFVEKTCSHLSGIEGEIPLVLSHGDYFSGNIVIEGESQKAIDWANMGRRSPLHDLYYLYLNHCSRVLAHNSLQRCIRASIGSLRGELESRHPQSAEKLGPFLTDSDQLRWIFYLECVQVPLVRCTDPDDRYLTSMLERLKWFSDFEEYLAADVSQSYEPTPCGQDQQPVDTSP